MDHVGVCIPVFMRTEKLRRLLESIEGSDLEQVYVADDGEETDEKRSVYERNYDFDLEVFDLEYDAGVGEKRAVLVEETEEDILFFLDSDMTLPSNYDILIEVLETDPRLGGVSGMYLEDGRVYTVATDIYRDGNVLYRDLRSGKSITFTNGVPRVTFDFLPQVGAYRRDCLDDYSWDPNYVIMREHIDFYVGHWARNDWEFALCPSVLFPHYPGGSADYVANRQSDSKWERSDEYFCEKWDVDDFVVATDGWIETYDHEIGGFPPQSGPSRVRAAFARNGPLAALKTAGGLALRRFDLR